jgi:hypothetical protein
MFLDTGVHLPEALTARHEARSHQVNRNPRVTPMAATTARLREVGGEVLSWPNDVQVKFADMLAGNEVLQGTIVS